MSAAAVSRHGPGSFDWAPNKLKNQYGLVDRYQGVTGELWCSDGPNWPRGSLPTPPSPKTMTAITLGVPGSNEPIQQVQAPVQFPRHNVVNGTSTASVFRKSEGHGNLHFPSSDGDGWNSRFEDYDGAADQRPAGDDVIASHLQIPESVNKSKGSLAEFAAEITCFFWFESEITLQFAEDIPNVSYIDRALVPDSIPSTGFRKWVTTILSTTQVGKNVILLALLFIYRLKKFTPGVSGNRGSEFRLLTIALMLGNKFLDDNTYTNKTWAEVSGIAVTEIHIMEVEFLSNMRYDLYVSEGEWREWKLKLGKFGTYYDQALQLYRAEETKSAMVITPTLPTFHQKLPSPPSTNHSASPRRTSQFSSAYPAYVYPTAAAPPRPRSPVRHYRNPVLQQLERKRSLDLSSEFPPAKRLHQAPSGISHPVGIPTSAFSMPTPGSMTAHTPSSTASGPRLLEESQPGGHSIPRLPVPRIQTNVPAMPQLAPLSFPSRAMSTVYPGSAGTWSQPTTPVSSLPPSNSLYGNPIPSLGEPHVEHNAYSAHPSPSHVFTPSRQGLSPSYFLTHRTSPYRPVRGVNTLLIPPPPASMANVARNIPFEQIYYQPLSKASTELRTGPLPYLQPDGWQQSNASTPIALPQYTYRH